MLKRLLLTGLASGLLLGGAGCRIFNRNKDKGCDTCPPGPGGKYLDSPVYPKGGNIPPPSVPTTPSLEPLPPPVVPDSRSSFRVDPRTPSGPWDPAPTTPLFGADTPPAPSKRSDLPPAAPAPARTDNKELVLPDPIPGGAPPELPSDRKPNISGFLEEPIKPNTATDLPPKSGSDSSKRPAVMDPAPPKSAATDRPGFLEDPTTTASPGLSGYSRVPGRSGVSSGRKPNASGLETLKNNGFKTVVFLHAPSTDVSALKNDTEQRGLRFVPIAVSPATLQKSLDEFTTIVDDRSARPVYVADEDGTRTGSLWYLLFRTQDLLNDDTARLRATPLGLSDAKTEEQKQFWLSIQDYLAKR